MGIDTLDGKTLVGGALPAKVKSAASDNATVVKAGPAMLCSVVLTNDNAAKRYLKLYNKATAPTNGDTPAFTHLIPAGGGLALDYGAAGIAFSIGLSYRITTAIAENDNTATGADEVTGVIGYA